MTVIIDYGVGNLFSLSSSLVKIGEEVRISSDKDDIKKADRLVLPGVGAFGDAADKLFKSGMAECVCGEAYRGKPVLGICLGMQLMFEKSFEYGEHRGLGLIEGEVREIPKNGLKIPHMGWNALKFPKERQKSELFKYVNEGECVYFVHSYYAKNCDPSVIATAEYGVEITAAVQKENVFACQFHPEKSGDTGLNILRAFCEMRGR